MKKNKKMKPSKFTRKAIKVRGGITGITPIRSLSSAGVKASIGKSFARIARSTAKNMLNKDYGLKAAFIEAINDEKVIKTGRQIFEMVAAPSIDTGSARQNDVPSVLVESSTKPVMGSRTPLSDSSKPSYRTSLDTGRPSTKTLLELGRENGVKRETVYDSKWFSPDAEIVSSFPRERLTNGHGFNLRAFHVCPEVASVTQRQVRESILSGLGAISDSISPVNTEQKIYGSLLQTTTMLQLFNQSRVFPIKFKIHVISKLDDTLLDTGSETRRITMVSAIDNNVARRQQTSVSETQQIYDRTYSSIPDYYLVGPTRFEGDISNTAQASQATLSWEMLNSGSGLMSSPYFRRYFSIIKTVQKTVHPGESWQFNHDHHHGAGIDMTKELFPTFVTDQQDFSVGYNYIIESSGLPCEGTFVDTFFKDPRFGTSPGYWFYEFKTQMKYVQASVAARDITSTTSNLFAYLNPPVRPGMHIRVFENDQAGTLNFQKRKPFYVRLKDIKGSAASAVAGDFYITATTDNIVIDGAASTTSDSGQSEEAGYGGRT